MKVQKPSLVLVAGASALAIAFASCSKSVDSTPIQSSQTNPSSNADVEAAELLLTPRQWEKGRAHFDLIASKNPRDSKANFYSAALDLLEISRGSASALSQMIGKGKAQADLSEFLAMLKQKNLDSLHAFLTRGASPLQSAEEARLYLLKKAIPRMESALAKLERVTDTVDVRFPRISWEDLARRENCYESSSTWICNPLTDDDVQVFSADAADVLQIRFALTGYLNQLRFVSAFKLEGYEMTMQELDTLQRSRSKPTSQQVIRILRKNPHLLTVDSAEQLRRITPSLESLVKIGMSLHALDAQTCSNDDRSSMPVLFRSLCFGANFADSVENLNRALQGPIMVTVGEIWNPETHEAAKSQARMDLSRFLANLQDGDSLLKLLPTNFDSRGEARLPLPDPTMRGLFPDGDIVEKRRRATWKSDPEYALRYASPQQTFQWLTGRTLPSIR